MSSRYHPVSNTARELVDTKGEFLEPEIEKGQLHPRDGSCHDVTVAT
jgi:hypothetical protein